MKTQSTNASVAATATANKRILLVEDDEAIQMSLREFFEQEQYDVHCESNGQAALNYLRSLGAENYPDLVLLDLFMPVMDGAEFFSEFKKNSQWLHNIPVVVMSAADEVTMKGIRNRMQALSGIIKKPFDFEQLMSIVNGY